jgi:hypothetical protein
MYNSTYFDSKDSVTLGGLYNENLERNWINFAKLPNFDF